MIEELHRLREQGLPIIFSTSIVTEHMRVSARSGALGGAEDPRHRLDEILSPFALQVVDTGSGFLVIAPATSVHEKVRVSLQSGPDSLPRSSGDCVISWQGPVSGKQSCQYPGVTNLLLPVGKFFLKVETTEHLPAEAELTVDRRTPGVKIELALIPRFVESIDVMSTKEPEALLADTLAPLRDIQDSLLTADPTLADPLRQASWVPGVANADGSARVWMRDGNPDQVMVRLDGHEIEEPYIFVGFFSKVSTNLVDDMKIMTGAFPVELGDRLGVIDLASADNDNPQSHFGLSYGFTQAHIDYSKNLSGGRFLLNARADQFRFFESMLRLEVSPRFHDLYAKGHWEPWQNQSLKASVLKVRDSFREGLRDQNEFLLRNDQSLDAWVDLLSPSRLGWLSTQVGVSRRQHDRAAHDLDPLLGFDLEESRISERFDGSQLVSSEVADHLIRWGWSFRDDRSTFELDSEWQIYLPLARLRTNSESGAFDGRFEFQEQQLSLHGSDTWRLGESLELETGLRFDRTRKSDQRHWSPRLFVKGEARRGVWHLGWGRYVQSHRPHELSVVDGETELAESEIIDRWVLGASWSLPGRWSLSAEAYSNVNKKPRARFLNLLAPDVLAPEYLVDRYLWASERRRAHGIDLHLTRRPGNNRLSGWLALSISRAEDRIENQWVRSPVDQPWTVRGGIRWSRGGWNLNLLTELREGLPISTLRLDSPRESGVPIPVIDELTGSRVPRYQRIDLDVSRQWQLAKGSLEVSCHVHNLLNRANIVGYKFSISEQDATSELFQERENWGFRALLMTIRWGF